MKKQSQKVTNKENNQKDSVHYVDMKSKYESKVSSYLQKDSIYDQNTLMASYNDQREVKKEQIQIYHYFLKIMNLIKQFIQDGLRKQSELPKYNMLKDKYLNHFFVSKQRSQQLQNLGVLCKYSFIQIKLEQKNTDEEERVINSKGNNLMSQTKFQCLSKSQQLSKECKVYIDKYLKQSQQLDKPQLDKVQKIQNVQNLNKTKKLPLIMDDFSSNNNLSYAEVRNQIVGLRFQPETTKENTEIKNHQNNSLQTSKFFSQQNSSRKQISISPIPKIRNQGGRRLDQSIKGFSPAKEIIQDISAIKENEETYQKELKTQDNQIQEIDNLEGLILIEKDVRSNSKQKLQNNHQKNSIKKFILKPVVKKSSYPVNADIKMKQDKFDLNKQNSISQKNSIKEEFYNQHEQKFLEIQKKKVIEVYNKNYSPNKKQIHPKSLERLYSTNIPKKPRVHETSVIQTLSRSEFLEFLKTNNEKIRQKNKITSTSKIGSKSYLQTEQDLDKKSVKLKTLQNLSQIPSQQQIKSVSKLPEEKENKEEKIVQKQVQSEEKVQTQQQEKQQNQ